MSSLPLFYLVLAKQEKPLPAFLLFYLSPVKCSGAVDFISLANAGANRSISAKYDPSSGLFPPRAKFMSPLPSPARKITTFSAGVVQVGLRAPLVVRCMHILDLPQSCRDPNMAEIHSFNILPDQGSDSIANMPSKRQATVQEFGFASVKRVRPTPSAKGASPNDDRDATKSFQSDKAKQ